MTLMPCKGRSKIVARVGRGSCVAQGLPQVRSELAIPDRMPGPIIEEGSQTGVYADMEQWADVRRAVLVEGVSKRQACPRFGIHWQTL